MKKSAAGGGGGGGGSGAAAATAESWLAPFVLPSPSVLLSPSGIDHYTALGFDITSDAAPLTAAQSVSALAIRTAYRTCALHYHPDKQQHAIGGGADASTATTATAAACFMRISAAFHALKSDTTRLTYDNKRLLDWTEQQQSTADAAAAAAQSSIADSASYYYSAGPSLFAAPSYQTATESHAPKPKPKPKPTAPAAANAFTATQTSDKKHSAPAAAANAAAKGFAVTTSTAAAAGLNDSEQLRSELERWKLQWQTESEIEKARMLEAERARFDSHTVSVEAKIGRVLLRANNDSAAAAQQTAKSKPVAIASAGVTASATAAVMSDAVRQLLTVGSRFQVRTSAQPKPIALVSTTRGGGGGGGARNRGSARGGGTAASSKAASTAAAAAALRAAKTAVYVSVWVDSTLDRLQWRIAGSKDVRPDGILSLSDITSVTPLSATAATNSNQRWFTIRSVAKSLTLEAESDTACKDWISALNTALLYRKQ